MAMQADAIRPLFNLMFSSDGSSARHTRKATNRQKDIDNALTVIPERLYFMTTRYRPRQTQTVHFFSIDLLLRYEPFFMDFGPLNLGCLYKFWTMIKYKLTSEELKNHKIYFYCDKDPQKIGNAAYLIGSYMVIELNMHPADAFRAIEGIAQNAMPFRDASMGICTYRCTVEHCLYAVYRAKVAKFLRFNDFNIDAYEFYERVECGDLNVIIPDKFIAFAGPNATDVDPEGYPALTPDYYIPIWKKFGVSTIIRLNKVMYDKKIFERAGFDHRDLFYTDGTCPHPEILREFISICEEAKGVIAVHCKAGLGRTGSCIGAYIMKHYGWTAEETTAWTRICRPGSIIGPQQHFLQQQQNLMWQEGERHRSEHGIEPNELTSRFNNTDDVMVLSSDTSEDDTIPLPTDPGQDQGGALNRQKRGHLSRDSMQSHGLSALRVSESEDIENRKTAELRVG